jgi:hypothetical protein
MVFTMLVAAQGGIDIRRAARLCVKEGPARFAPYESRAESAYSPETSSEIDEIVPGSTEAA